MPPSWRRQWQPIPVLLPGKSHGQRSLVGCSPWGHKESDTTERLHFHFSLSYWRRKWQPTPVFLPGESQGTVEPGGLPSMGSHRVGHDWSNLAAAAAVGYEGLPGGSVVKNPSANAGDEGLIPRSGRSPGEENGNSFVFLPRTSHRQRSLVGYSPLGCKKVEDTATNQQNWLIDFYIVIIKVTCPFSIYLLNTFLLSKCFAASFTSLFLRL